MQGDVSTLQLGKTDPFLPLMCSFHLGFMGKKKCWCGIAAYIPAVSNASKNVFRLLKNNL